MDHNPTRTAELEKAMNEIGYDVAALLGAGDEILSAVRRHQPDVILIDMALPDRDTLAACRT
ncbi:MAG: hypothetical protein ACYC3A_03565 [Halothiobacillus sp.]